MVVIFNQNANNKLKEMSINTNRAFSDVLWQYAAEDIIHRIDATNNLSQLWLYEWDYPQKLLKESCPKLTLLYKEEKKALDELLTDILGEKTDMMWDLLDEINRDDKTITWMLKGDYSSYEVSFPIIIRKLESEEWTLPAKGEFSPLRKRYIKIRYNYFAVENMLGQYVFEVINKLELINNMRAYAVINDFLKTSSVSGRHMVEELEYFIEKTPKVAREKRIDQIKGYRNYAYMRKRWNQYCKKNGIEDSWEDTLDRIVQFIEPLWRATCKNEVFFDDWMPELGRFLG